LVKGAVIFDGVKPSPAAENVTCVRRIIFVRPTLELSGSINREAIDLSA
jgi:hypothetical protein